MMIVLYIVDAAFALLCGGILIAVVQNKRIGLLLPAAAYGISSAVSFFLESWWPLFFGLAVARLFATLGTGVDPQPAQRPSPTGMILNHVLHVWAGVVGSEVFSLSVPGIAFAILFVGILQGLDTISLYHRYTKLLTASSPEALKQLPIKTAWLFTMKVLWYGMLTIVAAIVVRRLS